MARIPATSRPCHHNRFPIRLVITRESAPRAILLGRPYFDLHISAHFRRLRAKREVTISKFMKASRLKPAWDESHQAWRLNIPANLSASGKRRQEFYPTKIAAVVAGDQYKARRDSFGGTLSTMSPARIGEA